MLLLNLIRSTNVALHITYILSQFTKLNLRKHPILEILSQVQFHIKQ